MVCEIFMCNTLETKVKKKKKKVFQTEYIIEFIKVDEQNKVHTSFAN